MYRNFSKLFALKLILALILSHIVLAQDFDNSFGSESEDEFRERLEIREELRNDGREIRAEVKSEFGDFRFEERFEDDRFEERYEFRDRGRYEPDFGPEYENKEEMLFGRLFHLIEDEINEFEMMKLCGTPDKIADVVVEKVKGKIGDISNACSDIEEEEIECKERIEEDCSQIGKPDLRFARDERERMEMEAWACPPHKEVMVELCILDSQEWILVREHYLEEDCEFEWERFGGHRDPECKRIKEECDKDAFTRRCMGGFGDFEEECPDIPPEPECSDGFIEDEYDHKGCLIGFRCIKYSQPEPEACPEIYEPVCGDDGVTYANDCKADKAGVGYRYGECKNCPISEGEAQRIYDDCIASGGNPEKIWDGDCVTDVICNLEPQCPITPEGAEILKDECVANNGTPEEVWDADCIVDVLCNTAENGNQITGSVVGISGAFTKEEASEQCRRDWENQQQYCEDLKVHCNKDEYVNECIAREKENIDFDLENSKRQCERDARIQLRHAERECSRMDAEREMCFEEGNRQCERMAGLANECRATMTEENFRAFIVKEAEKHCKFVPFIKKKEEFREYEKMSVTLAVLDTITQEEIDELQSIVENLKDKYELDGKIIMKGMIRPNNFKLLERFNFVIDAKLHPPELPEKAVAMARLNPEKVVKRLLELRDTKVSSEYRYLIEDEASDILEVSDDLGNLAEREQEKGFAYKIRLFLGFAKDVEEGEIQRLGQSRQRLETSISSLSRLAETIPDDIARSILIAQVEELERQKADMDDLIQQKEKKAKGLIRLFGLFG